ncbi:septal ring lytic transglycosylase RlpA family protein [Myroides odoratimimus]|uniref:septal ring lytic transglycosylase RlpA family protein n=1 Tax=Myroides TaxID=76831 RepID=UPI000915AEC5|nr:septal ring lytic transglycosylase RlpA family protein [Myroides odoratimimus]MCA4792832.1 septal ring lytic transglycosylase RlpA family protein [Myroides odoratimimus]MCA4806004.1 septal ring lytic transglycosylase RlpA family protein [Myroides odoratimimus]MCA4820008.1 septal ring lytic transglycosylase RlpA family protein [Myroides odoratimimus]MCO7722007.1 septal ring lytic transglycosylase RlpA family protein [Myroides odoratimimus]MDM1057837.1 septal ring lytic transglycosylase RlpA 
MKTYQYLLAISFVIFLSSFGGTTRIIKENNVKTSLTKVTPDSLELDNDSIVMGEEETEDFIVVDDDTQASYYHDKFTGRKTASGEVFDNQKYTAAHKTLPFGTKVKVTNLKNKRFVILTITDRGPFVKGRSIDISKKAFGELTDNVGRGVLDVKIEKFIGENEEQL